MIYFIAGIDTDIGKTIITGHLAKYLKDAGNSVITQKIVQTGCKGISEDIIKHRKIMESGLYPEDNHFTTCPYVFKFPSSPELAAKLEGKQIDLQIIKENMQKLNKNYHYVLLEGAGGVHVPLTKTTHLIDFLEQEKLPVFLITSPKLGSINHTLLSIETLFHRKIPLKGLIYNLYPQQDEKIIKNSKEVFYKNLKKFQFPEVIVEFPVIQENSKEQIDFSSLFF